MLKPFNNHILVEIGEASAIQVANLDNTWTDVPKGTITAVPEQWVLSDNDIYNRSEVDDGESPFEHTRLLPETGDKVLYKPGAHIVKFEENSKNYVIIPLDAVIAVEEATK